MTSLNSHDGFKMPSAPFLFALKDKCKCWRPVWNATWRRFLGYFLRVMLGRVRKMLFFSRIWFSKRNSSTGRKLVSSLEKTVTTTTTTTTNGLISRPSTIHLPSQRTSRHRKAREDSFCLPLMILHLVKSSTVRVAFYPFQGEETLTFLPLGASC